MEDRSPRRGARCRHASIPRLIATAAAVCAIAAVCGFGLLAASPERASAHAARDASASSGSTAPTTAWDGHGFAVDAAGVVGENDVALGQPPLSNAQSMPLGNGTLGGAAWDADGETVQLNRADTMPNRLSPGQVVIPGLEALDSASDYKGRLDLYDAMLRQSGGGMTSATYIRADKDELVVSVTGANPNVTQTAQIQLWSPRTPVAAADGSVAMLSQTWNDTRGNGASHAPEGSLAAITAGGRDVTARVVNSLTVEVSFKPHADGSFTVLVAAPHFNDTMHPLATARRVFGADADASSRQLAWSHLMWWHRYWNHVGLIQMASADGDAQYMENIRTLAQYDEASAERGRWPGSQAGVADMFSSVQDTHQWDPSAFWHWNLRGQVAMNMGDGAFALDRPYFSLYRNDLPELENWTKTQFPGKTGICVPETMRFNGYGWENETWAAPALNCSASGPPYYNARTLTTGAEVALNAWLYYEYTGDRRFLAANFPLMAQSAQFLLSYATLGSDGKLHTYPSNAHETQWDVHDPTTDIAAMHALFPAVIEAASVLHRTHRDSVLIAKLTKAEQELLPYPTTGTGSSQVIADSYDPTAPLHNTENIGLEPVWPYGLIGDHDGAMTTLARQTYALRPNVWTNDWSFDAIDAARLGLASQVQGDLVGLTEEYQQLPSGLAHFVGSESYQEQSVTAGDAIQEALAQDYNGTLQIAPAWPRDWNVSGTVYTFGRSKVHVQVQKGTVTTAVLQSGFTGSQPTVNPWPGQSVEVVAEGGSSHRGHGHRARGQGHPGHCGHGHRTRGQGHPGGCGHSHRRIVVAPTTASRFTIPVRAGLSYVIERVSAPTSRLKFAPLTGTVPTTYRTMGSVSIGVPAPPPPTTFAAALDNVGITSDTATDAGNIDGGGASLSAQALAAVGASPGSTITHDGMSFTWPSVAAGRPDNVIAAGQRIELPGSGSTLGVLLTATYGPITATGTVTYTDGSTSQFTLTSPDWGGPPTSGSDAALVPAYQNRPGNTQYDVPATIYYNAVPLTAGKTVAMVTLPNVSGTTPARVPILHIFALSVGTPQATTSTATTPTTTSSASRG